jgi:CRP-like cAMP-binding protein
METAAAGLRYEFRLPEGQVVFGQGDPGEEMFVIIKGRVRLILTEGAHRREIAMLHAGDFFGELSLLTGSPRTATAETAEECTLLAIGRDVFAMMMQDDLEIVFQMLNVIGRRLGETDRQTRELVERFGQVRILARGLQRFAEAGAASAAVLTLGTLAADLDLADSAVQATVEAAVRRGAGVLEDNEWRLRGQEDLRRLTEALCGLARC